MVKKTYSLEARARIGARLRAFREKAGMTQQDIADKTGIHFQTISKMENGRWNFGVDLIESYANALGMKLDFKVIAGT